MDLNEWGIGTIAIAISHLAPARPELRGTVLLVAETSQPTANSPRTLSKRCCREIVYSLMMLSHNSFSTSTAEGLRKAVR